MIQEAAPPEVSVDWAVEGQASLEQGFGELMGRQTDVQQAFTNYLITGSPSVSNALGDVIKGTNSNQGEAYRIANVLSEEVTHLLKILEAYRSLPDDFGTLKERATSQLQELLAAKDLEEFAKSSHLLLDTFLNKNNIIAIQAETGQAAVEDVTTASTTASSNWEKANDEAKASAPTDFTLRLSTFSQTANRQKSQFNEQVSHVINDKDGVMLSAPVALFIGKLRNNRFPKESAAILLASQPSAPAAET